MAHIDHQPKPGHDWSKLMTIIEEERRQAKTINSRDPSNVLLAKLWPKIIEQFIRNDDDLSNIVISDSTITTTSQV